MRQIATHAGPVDDTVFARLAGRLGYVAGDHREAGTFRALCDALGGARHPLFYLAIPPSLFATVVERLQKADLAEAGRLMVEKPFGRNCASARALIAVLNGAFDEPAIFRIDHNPGKGAIQNLLNFHFAIAFLEPIRNRDHVDSVQITVDGNSALRDAAGSATKSVRPATWCKSTCSTWGRCWRWNRR